jgi:hypothetical protein
MSQPAVTITETDGSLGVLPDGASAFALCGVADAGPLTPAAYARTKDVVVAYTAGPLVEAACHYIERYQRPVLLCRTGATVAGTHTDLDVSGVVGTSVATIDTGDEEPNDDYEPYLIVRTGGTIGVTGIVIQYSLDGGRNLSPLTALGTANTFAFPGSGGIGYDFAAGTLVAGDVITSRATAPNWNATELGTALDALKDTSTSWDVCEIVGPLDATSYDTVTTKAASMHAAGKPKFFVGSFRMPTVGETEAQYKTAFDTAFSAKSSTYLELCSGAVEMPSAVSGRKYRRPFAFAQAALEASVSEEVNVADPNLGAMVGVSIRDTNGNAKHHDETLNPGLDDSRSSVARTWNEFGSAGVYPNRPRLHSAAGSDFQIAPHRRVMNLAHVALRAYFVRRLNKQVLVHTTTGFILESEALEIEKGADAILRSVLMAKPKASGGGFPQGRFVRLSRTDNLLSTKTMTGQARIVPLAYPEFVSLDLGFYNPALQVVAV